MYDLVVGVVLYKRDAGFYIPRLTGFCSGDLRLRLSNFFSGLLLGIASGLALRFGKPPQLFKRICSASVHLGKE